MKRIEWENYQDGDSTPLNAENLNLMQNNIEEAIDNIDITDQLALKADKKDYIQTDDEHGSVGIGDIPKQEDNSLTVAGNVYASNIGNILTVGISSDTTLTTTDETKLAINTVIEQMGNKLSLSGGKVIIGSGVSYVKTSASIYVSTGITTASLMHCIIKLNGTSVNQQSLRVSTTYNTLNTAVMLVKVKEGDEIELHIRNQTVAEGVINSQDNRTYLTVEIVG